MKRVYQSLEEARAEYAPDAEFDLVENNLAPKACIYARNLFGPSYAPSYGDRWALYCVVRKNYCPECVWVADNAR